MNRHQNTGWTVAPRGSYHSLKVHESGSRGMFVYFHLDLADLSIVHCRELFLVLELRGMSEIHKYGLEAVSA